MSDDFELGPIIDGKIEIPMIDHVMITPEDCEIPIKQKLGDLGPEAFKAVCDCVTMNMIAVFKEQGGDIDALAELEGD